jgi:transcriptional regulator with XRE-family HTH domain
MPKGTKPLPAELLGFPERLRRARVDSGLGVRQLIEASGVAGISRYERGIRFEGISMGSVISLAKSLGVRVAWLATGELPIRANGAFAVVELTPQLVEILRQSAAQLPPVVAIKR